MTKKLIDLYEMYFPIRKPHAARFNTQIICECLSASAFDCISMYNALACYRDTGMLLETPSSKQNND